MILKHSTINLKFCNSLNSQHFQNCVKTEQHSCEDLMVMTFALQKLLRKTVYCQNFATQNRLRRQRSSLFLTATFSSGCILVRSVLRNLSAHTSQKQPCDL